MWVEITGLPGSGKTTATSLLRQFLADAGQPTHSPASALVGPRLARWLPWDAVHNRILERFPRSGETPLHETWNRLHRLVSEIAATPAERSRLARAVLRQQRIAAIPSPLRRNLVVDEGPRQLLMSLWTRTSSLRIRDTLSRLDLPWPDHLIVIEARPDTALVRLRQRGHLPFPDRSVDALPERLAASEDALRNSLVRLPPHTRLWIIANETTFDHLRGSLGNVGRALLSSPCGTQTASLHRFPVLREFAA